MPLPPTREMPLPQSREMPLPPPQLPIEAISAGMDDLPIPLPLSSCFTTGLGGKVTLARNLLLTRRREFQYKHEVVL